MFELINLINLNSKSGSTAGSSSLAHPTSKRKSDDKPEIANNVPDYSDVLDDSKSISNFFLNIFGVPHLAILFLVFSWMVLCNS
jgi:hypothetical protein